jgi:hypothetical protein
LPGAGYSQNGIAGRIEFRPKGDTIMRGKTLFLITLTVAALAAIAVVRTAHAAKNVTGPLGFADGAQGCTTATIAGSYGIASDGMFSPTFSGQPQKIGEFIPIAFAGTFSFDGRGAASRAATLSAGGQINSFTDSGTYTVNSNCTGSVVFPGAGETWNLVIVSRKEIKTLNATSGIVAAGVLTQQQKSEE